MSVKHETKRVADTECETCGKMAPVIEQTVTGVGCSGSYWEERTLIQVDRTVHCPGHMKITRHVADTVRSLFPRA